MQLIGKMTITCLTFQENLRALLMTVVGEWILVGFREGYGTTTEPRDYSFVDDVSGITANSLAYRLKQIDFDGSYEYSDEVLVDNPAPSDYALHQNYPNPFNPVTTISYSLPLKSQVELIVYNTFGEELIQLVNGEKEAGSYSVKLNANGLSSGIYFYKLQAGDFIKTKKMILMK
ncbi:MAG: T9SS type A sorting domain-containing protein [Candidatus Dadabacteria bacterium]|nr:T9SS type A sorting domain-containing protein [Candidatus Dadabacteria bacterium]MCZ6864122.1 T9SS type A sorting domain-containing protein [Candidatus Dadabacteria bacterium]